MVSPSTKKKENKLLKKLQELRANGISHAKLAERARISNKTITSIFSGEFATERDPSSRQLQGWAESLTRLAIFAQVDVDETLAAFKIARTEAVQNAVQRAKREASGPHLLSDPTIDAIRARGYGDGDEGTVKVGIINWPPFGSREGKVERTLAAKFVTLVVGSINPKWKISFQRVSTIGQCIDSLIIRPNEQEFDLLFSLYDSAYRRSLELDFVNLPGLRFPLGALTSSVHPLTWQEISLTNSASKFRLLVLKEEVGHLYLQGPCGYDDSEITVMDLLAPVEIAERLHREIVECGSRQDIIFIADRQVCHEVLLATRKTTRPNGNGAMLGGGLSIVPTSNFHTPIFRAGMAIRADATQWKRLLQFSQSQELFGHAIGITAKIYAEVLRDFGSRLAWSWKDSEVSIDLFKPCVEEAIIQHSTRNDHEGLRDLMPVGWEGGAIPFTEASQNDF